MGGPSWRRAGIGTLHPFKLLELLDCCGHHSGSQSFIEVVRLHQHMSFEMSGVKSAIYSTMHSWHRRSNWPYTTVAFDESQSPTHSVPDRIARLRSC